MNFVHDGPEGFGTMLGDCTAEKSQLNGNTRLRFYMSSVNKDLIFHLYSIFEPYVKTAPTEVVRKQNKLTGKIHSPQQVTDRFCEKYLFTNICN